MACLLCSFFLGLLLLSGKKWSSFKEQFFLICRNVQEAFRDEKALLWMASPHMTLGTTLWTGLKPHIFLKSRLFPGSQGTCLRLACIRMSRCSSPASYEWRRSDCVAWVLPPSFGGLYVRTRWNVHPMYAQPFDSCPMKTFPVQWKHFPTTGSW